MKISKNSIILTAAFAGLVSGTVARAAQPMHSADAIFAGMMADKKAIEKHACKGLNSCKGNGGGDASQFGKNDCKGKSACATYGSAAKKSK